MGHLLEELGAAEHPLHFFPALGFRKTLDPGVRGVAGHLLDAKMGLSRARDLRQVRDREDLCPLREAAERVCNRMRRAPADARVDLVEDDCRLAGAGMGDRP